MHDALIISQIVLWIAVVALSAVVLALVRQIGVLHERIAPMGALTIDKGPKVGEHSPVFELVTLDDRPLTIGAPNSRKRSTLLMFVSPSCPVCKKLLPAVKSMVAKEARWLDLVFTSDGDPGEQADFARKQRLDESSFALSSELGMTYRVSKLPYAVLIDEEGIVRAKGLVNTREHLESIVQAKQMGVASLQEYLTRRHDHSAHAEREHHG
ncbi:MAG TPA: methylamine dehydrogenase accessory protein MauD [Candidatus Binataceae bacterium]|nr:methylamine dehydrogenase accessory protein MauD [Candidatus Binataceae bacterium]